MEVEHQLVRISQFQYGLRSHVEMFEKAVQSQSRIGRTDDDDRLLNATNTSCDTIIQAPDRSRSVTTLGGYMSRRQLRVTHRRSLQLLTRRSHHSISSIAVERSRAANETG